MRFGLYAPTPQPAPPRSRRFPTTGSAPATSVTPDMFTQSTLDMFNVDFSPENRHYF